MRQGRKWQVGHLNMQKAPGQSQLRKTDTGALERNGPTGPERAWSRELTWCDMARPTELYHIGANGKWAARTCTMHLGGQNLAKLIRAPLKEMDQPGHAQSGDLTWRDMARPTE